ncbi:hypothetical protein ANTPLA_LOCUS6744 [Anthophora plagiata]
MATYSENRREIQGRRLFITRLPPYTKKEKLLKIFHQYEAEHAVVLKRPIGNQAFITFETKEGARETILAGRTGIICHNRKLRVLPANLWHEAKLLSPRPEVTPFPGLNLTESVPLPIELISKIAQHLPFADRSRLELISRRWRLGSLSSYSNFKILNLNDWRWPNGWEGKVVTGKALYWLINRISTHLQTINLSEQLLTKDLQPQVIVITVKTCPHLTSIDLTGITVRPTTLRNLTQIARNLSTLAIGPCEGTIDAELSEILTLSTCLESFKAINATFSGKFPINTTTSLKSLILHNCDYLNPYHLATAIQNFHNLEDLYIISCKLLNRGNILQALIDNNHLRDILRTLEIHNCNFTEPPLEEEAIMEPEEGQHINQMDFIELELGPAREALPLPARFFAEKDSKFWKDGIMKLPIRWQKVIDQNGQYII